MRNGGGSIINIASTRAYMSEPGSEAYAASNGRYCGADTCHGLFTGTVWYQGQLHQPGMDRDR